MDERLGYCGYDLRNLDEMRMSWRVVGEVRWNHWLCYAIRRGEAWPVA